MIWGIFYDKTEPKWFLVDGDFKGKFNIYNLGAAVNTISERL